MPSRRDRGVASTVRSEINESPRNRLGRDLRTYYKPCCSYAARFCQNFPTMRLFVSTVLAYLLLAARSGAIPSPPQPAAVSRRDQTCPICPPTVNAKYQLLGVCMDTQTPSATITYALLASYEGIDVHEYGECDYFVRSFSVLSGRAGYSVNIFSPTVISTRQVRTSTVAPRRSRRTVPHVFRVIRSQSLLGRMDVRPVVGPDKDSECIIITSSSCLQGHYQQKCHVGGYIYDHRLYFRAISAETSTCVSCFSRHGISSSGGS